MPGIAPVGCPGQMPVSARCRPKHRSCVRGAWTFLGSSPGALPVPEAHRVLHIRLSHWRSNDHSSFQDPFQARQQRRTDGRACRDHHPARATEGVVEFDIARVLSDPDTFIATAIYEDGAALDRQESLPQVHTVMAMLPESLVAPPERTIFDAAVNPTLV
jgi:quinol monooxygenase YgiN